MDATLLAGIFAVLGAALGAVGAYLIKVREDVSVGRAAESLLELDLERARAAAHARVVALTEKWEADSIVENPDAELEKLKARDDYGTGTAGRAVPDLKQLPSLAAWEHDRDRLAARLDKRALHAIQRAVWAIERFNEIAGSPRPAQGQRADPTRAARQALASVARAENEVGQSMTIQSALDWVPVVGVGVLAVAAVLGILALAGVFSDRPTEDAVADALGNALPGEQIVDCKRGSTSGRYDCKVLDPTCKQAADTPVTCPAGMARMLDGMIVFEADESPIDAVTSGEDPAKPKSTDCPVEQQAVALSEDELKQIEKTPLPERSKLRKAVHAIVLCVGKVIKGSVSSGRTAATSWARVRSAPIGSWSRAAPSPI